MGIAGSVHSVAQSEVTLVRIVVNRCTYSTMNASNMYWNSLIESGCAIYTFDVLCLPRSPQRSLTLRYFAL